MAEKTYLCDIPDSNGKFSCPFATEGDVSNGFFCRDNCGLGVDEDEPAIREDEIDESMNPYDGTYDWQQDYNDGENW